MADTTASGGFCKTWPDSSGGHRKTGLNPPRLNSTEIAERKYRNEGLREQTTGWHGKLIEAR